MALELGPRRSAVGTLGAGYSRWSDAAGLEGLDRLTRFALKSGVIRHFEIAWKRSWKLMRRWLLTAAADVFRRDPFRQATAAGLITEVDRWLEHHAASNLTMRTYDLEMAERVLEAVPDFLVDLRSLLRVLASRND